MTVASHAEMLIALGYHVHPIPNGYKYPAGMENWEIWEGDVMPLINEQGGIGVRTDNMVVVDCDIKADADGIAALASIYRMNSAELPAPTSRTGGGGLHYWFAGDSSITSGVGKPCDGIDIRAGNGAQIVVPPSPHKSGQRYEWYDNAQPPHISQLPALPDFLRSMLIPRPQPRRAIPYRNSAGGSNYRNYWKKILLDVRNTTEGKRNTKGAIAAWGAGRIVEGRRADWPTLREDLGRAIMATGLPEGEIYGNRGVLRDGEKSPMNNGTKKPLE